MGFAPSGKEHALLNVPPPLPVIEMVTLLKTALLQAYVALLLFAKITSPPLWVKTPAPENVSAPVSVIVVEEAVRVPPLSVSEPMLEVAGNERLPELTVTAPIVNVDPALRSMFAPATTSVAPPEKPENPETVAPVLNVLVPAPARFPVPLNVPLIITVLGMLGLFPIGNEQLLLIVLVLE